MCGWVNNIPKCINNVVNCNFSDESKLVIGNVFLNTKMISIIDIICVCLYEYNVKVSVTPITKMMNYESMEKSENPT